MNKFKLVPEAEVKRGVSDTPLDFTQYNEMVRRILTDEQMTANEKIQALNQSWIWNQRFKESSQDWRREPNFMGEPPFPPIFQHYTDPSRGHRGPESSASPNLMTDDESSKSRQLTLQPPPLPPPPLTTTTQTRREGKAGKRRSSMHLVPSLPYHHSSSSSSAPAAQAALPLPPPPAPLPPPPPQLLQDSNDDDEAEIFEGAPGSHEVAAPPSQAALLSFKEGRENQRQQIRGLIERYLVIQDDDDEGGGGRLLWRDTQEPIPHGKWGKIINFLVPIHGRLIVVSRPTGLPLINEILFQNNYDANLLPNPHATEALISMSNKNSRYRQRIQAFNQQQGQGRRPASTAGRRQQHTVRFQLLNRRHGVEAGKGGGRGSTTTTRDPFRKIPKWLKFK